MGSIEKAGAGRAGSGGKKTGEGAGRRACKHCFKNLIPPTFKKDNTSSVSNVKMPVSSVSSYSRVHCLTKPMILVTSRKRRKRDITTSQRVRCRPCEFHAISPTAKRTQEHLSSSPVFSRSPRRLLALSDVNWESLKGG